MIEDIRGFAVTCDSCGKYLRDEAGLPMLFKRAYLATEYIRNAQGCGRKEINFGEYCPECAKKMELNNND